MGLIYIKRVKTWGDLFLMFSLTISLYYTIVYTILYPLSIFKITTINPMIFT